MKKKPLKKREGTLEESSVPSFLFESRHGYPARLIAGIDEVGRGCLAGAVVAGAVILPASWAERQPDWAREVRDSKLLTPEARERLAPLIRAEVLAWGLGEASVEEIDRINIYHASHRAMERAYAQASRAHAGAFALVDGNRVPAGFGRGRAEAVVKGDLRSLTIACASIIAKVHRDTQMREAALAHPGYGFEVHKGYSTPQHAEALTRLGPCAIHRRSFAPVAALLPREEQARLL